MALLDGLGKAFKALDCAILGSGAYIFGSLNALQGLDQGTVADVINSYRRLRGCNPAGDIAPSPGQFSGGQCPTSYLLTITKDGGIIVFQDNVVGPISGVSFVPIGSGDLKRTNVFTANGLVSSPGASFISAVEEQTMDYDFVRNDGLPDDCGNISGPLPPTINLDIDVDVEFVDEGDNIVNITIPVEFNPFTVNFNGDISFPFNFSLGGFQFNGDVSFDPDFRFNVGGPRLPRGGGGETFNPADDDNERPEAAPEANIVGAVVTVTELSSQSATGIDFVNGPDTFAPRLGSLKFAFSVGAATFWSNDIDIKSRSAFIPCPFSQGADAIAATPVPGVTLTARPVFGFPLATIGDLKTVLDVI